MKYDFCAIRDYRPSTRTIAAIKEINNTVKMSKYLAGVISITPVFAIFAGRGPIEAGAISSGYNLYNYNWNDFSDALSGIPDIERRTIETIALNESMYQMGKDYEFWKCVYNAL
ncbi:hypothetical protein VA7868_01501 [Vibrio aerogenes CECT 7868]|uniref:Uncharacterized protein n=1 Tax=Vibrio aerogenes CECT 7868 TaxID=1216006 RepID=A0A1M5Y4Y8_9VIBR|nr:hypothetical protein [Vibrio aerogenes]SHI07140.1 hypothetical protein VA7868_01501 [Vibrio aerogenes CECT 7868]